MSDIVMIDASARGAQVPLDSSNAMANDGKRAVVWSRVLVQRLFALTDSLVHVVAVVGSVMARFCIIKASLVLLWGIGGWASRSIELEVEIGSSLVSIWNIRVVIATAANVSRDVVHVVAVGMVWRRDGCAVMLLKVYNLRHVGLVSWCRDAECDWLLNSIDVLIMIDDILCAVVVVVASCLVLRRRLCGHWLKVVGFGLAVFVIIILSVVAVGAR